MALSSNSQPLLYKLPAELRMRIYKMVLRSKYLLRQHKRNSRHWSYPAFVDIALLLLNREMHEEALDAFYEANTIQLQWDNLTVTQPAFVGALRNVGHVELVRRIALSGSRWWDVAEKLAWTIRKCVKFPRLVTLTVVYIVRSRNGKESEFFQAVKKLELALGAELRRIEDGRFALIGDGLEKVQLMY